MTDIYDEYPFPLAAWGCEDTESPSKSKKQQTTKGTKAAMKRNDVEKSLNKAFAAAAKVKQLYQQAMSDCEVLLRAIENDPAYKWADNEHNKNDLIQGRAAVQDMVERLSYARQESVAGEVQGREHRDVARHFRHAYGSRR